MRTHTTVLALAHASSLFLIIIHIIAVSALIAAVREVLSARQARDDITGSACDDVALEEHVDALERDALCFGDAEHGVDDHDDAGAAEDEEGAVGDAVEHYGGELVGRVRIGVSTGGLGGLGMGATYLGNDKVEEPLGHKSCGHCEGSNVVGLCGC